MINITFPDDSKKQYDKGITGLDIAKSISEGWPGMCLLLR